MKFMIIMAIAPVLLLLVGSIAGVVRASFGLLVIPGFLLVLSFVYILAVWLDISGPWLLFVQIWTTGAMLVVLPWAVTIVAFAAGQWKGSAAEQTYSGLSPEEKAKVYDFGKTVFKAGCKAYEDRLQREGKTNAAGVVNKLRQL